MGGGEREKDDFVCFGQNKKNSEVFLSKRNGILCKGKGRRGPKRDNKQDGKRL